MPYRTYKTTNNKQQITVKSASDSNQIAPLVVQPLNSESSIPPRHDQMPKHCAPVKQSFLVAEARRKVGQN